MYYSHEKPLYTDDTNIDEESYNHDFIDPAEEIIEESHTILTISPREEEWNLGWYDDLSDITDEDYLQYFNDDDDDDECDDDDDDDGIVDKYPTSVLRASTSDQEEETMKYIIPVSTFKRGISATTEGTLTLYFNEKNALSGGESYRVIDVSRHNQ
jgi:hypothetical protein